LLEHVVERAVRRFQQLDDVVARPEDGAERHGDDRVIAHDGLVHQLVREHVLPRGVVDPDRRVTYDRGQVAVVHRVDAVATVTDADRTEIALFGRLDDTIDVLALVRGGLGDVLLTLLDLVVHGSDPARATTRRTGDAGCGMRCR